MASKKTLELNPHNSIVKELRKKVAKDKADESVRDLNVPASRRRASSSRRPRRRKSTRTGLLNSRTVQGRQGRAQ